MALLTARSRRRTLSRFLRRSLPLIGIALLILMVRQIDRDAAWEALDRLPSLVLLAAGLLFGGNLLLKAGRWSALLRIQQTRIPGVGVAVAYFSALLYGAVTVGRVGELFRAGIVVRSGRTPGFAVSSILFDRVLDVAFLAWIALVLGMITLGHPGTAASIGALLLLGGIAAGHGLSRSRLAPFGELAPSEDPVPSGDGQGIRATLSRTAARIVPTTALEGGAEFLRGLRLLLRGSALVRALTWTGLAWTLYLASVWTLAFGLFSSPPNPGLLALATSLSALSTLLPISIHGLGVREVVFAQVLAIEGVPATEAVTLSLVSFVAMLSVSVLMGGAALFADALAVDPVKGPVEET